MLRHENILSSLSITHTGAHPKGVEGQGCRTAAPQFEIVKNNDVVGKVIWNVLIDLPLSRYLPVKAPND